MPKEGCFSVRFRIKHAKFKPKNSLVSVSIRVYRRDIRKQGSRASVCNLLQEVLENVVRNILKGVLASPDDHGHFYHE